MAMPQITYALTNWKSDIKIIKMQQLVVDYEVTFIQSPLTFTGVIQPLSIETLNSYPEGQRDRKWLDLHTKINLMLDNNDKVIYKDLQYKVMAVNDWGLNNFYEYHLCQDDTDLL